MGRNRVTPLLGALLDVLTRVVRRTGSAPTLPAPTGWNPSATPPPPFVPPPLPADTPAVFQPPVVGEPGSCLYADAGCRDLAWCETMRTCQRKYDAPADAPHLTEGEL
jgi:hypothetical protein